MKAHLGQADDTFIGKASTQVAKAWCEAIRVPQSARFAISLYGEFGANVLARAWCHRRQHYLDIFLDSGLPEYEYSKEDHESYVEPDDLQSLVPALEGKALQRVQQLRSIRPARAAPAEG